MYAKKTDSNHVEISKALRQLGAVVHNLSRQGEGIPDLLVGYRGHTLLVEIKSSHKATYTPAQRDFFANWTGGMVATIHDIDGAVTLIKTLTKK